MIALRLVPVFCSQTFGVCNFAAASNRFVVEESSTDVHEIFIADILVTRFVTGKWLNGEYDSKTFTANNGQEQFRLEVNPNGRNADDEGFVSAYLSLLKSPREFVFISVDICVLALNGSKSAISKWIMSQLVKRHSRGFNNLVSRQDVINLGLANNDTLKVRVQGSYLISRRHVTTLSSLPNNKTNTEVSTVDIKFTWKICNWTKLAADDQLASPPFPLMLKVAKFRLKIKVKPTFSEDISISSFIDSIHDGLVYPLNVLNSYELLNSSKHVVVAYISSSHMYKHASDALSVDAFINRLVEDSLTNQCATFKYGAIYALTQE